jgi:hypothetical protein
MKFPNYLINSLAIVGIFSLIIMACSADNSNNTNNVNSVGRYQITALNGPTSTPYIFYVIDTETGVVKTFKTNSQTSNVYNLTSTTATQ